MALEGKEGVTETSRECCMCGDYGLEHELFHCRVCGFRSQHRYCSNLYPKVESYNVCNWCLKKEEDAHNNSSSSSPSSHGNRSSNNEEQNNTHLNLKAQKSNPDSQLHLMINNKPIKKQRSPDRSLFRKKTNFSNRMPKFDEISETRMTKKVFRGRIPRYKLLEEVCR